MPTAEAASGPYEAIAPVNAGGMGVFPGALWPLGRIVALKTSREQFTGRFPQETRAAAALNHPHNRDAPRCRARLPGDGIRGRRNAAGPLLAIGDETATMAMPVEGASANRDRAPGRKVTHSVNTLILIERFR